MGPTQHTLEVLEHRAANHHLALVHTKQRGCDEGVLRNERRLLEMAKFGSPTVSLSTKDRSQGFCPKEEQAGASRVQETVYWV